MKKSNAEMITLFHDGHVYTFPSVSEEFYGKPGWASLFTMEGDSYAVTWVGAHPQAYGVVGRLERIVEAGRVTFQAVPRPFQSLPTVKVQPADKTSCSTCAHNHPSGCGPSGFAAECLAVAPAKHYTRAAFATVKVEVKQDNGSNGSYYEVDCVSHKDGREYMAECQDIIDALQMTFNEGNTFKSLWRLAAARLGKVKGEGGKELYDAQKVEFYGKRVLKAQEAKQ